MSLTAQTAENVLDQQLVDQWKDWKWRLSNLYYIITDEGKKVRFRPNAAQLDFIANLWYLNIILKARQEGFCLDPATRVLTADLRWVRIDSLRLGEQIVAVDEHPLKRGKGQTRKMRTGQVQGVVEVEREAFQITLDDGREVICTDQHPWLSRPAGGNYIDWRKIAGGNKKKLRIGSQIRWITQPWEEGDFEDGWYGGMLDGEGSISKKNVAASIGCTQVDGKVLDRMHNYLSDHGYNYRVEIDDRKAGESSKLGNKPVHKLVVGKLDELFRLVGQSRPSRFLGNRFWEGRELPGKRANNSVGWATITGITSLGLRKMIDLQTSTGTYIAEGLVSHNTTLIDLMLLDACVFNRDQTAGIIAQSLDAASKIFRKKVLFPYEKLPAGIRQSVSLKKETQTELWFSNNSDIGVGVSMRSGTLQYLHISEFGKIAKKFPEKAEEIVTGAFNTVAPGQFIMVESTGEGRSGRFFDMCQDAIKLLERGLKLTELDYRFHFYPWMMKKKNFLKPEGIEIPLRLKKYFERLEKKSSIILSAGQKAWYVKTEAIQKDMMNREHPSTPDEAFESAHSGIILANEMSFLREQKRLRRVPHVPTEPVNTFWDIGRSKGNAMCLWFHQYIAGEHRFFHFYQKESQGLAHFYKYLQDLGYIWGKHYVPHDAENINLERSESRVDRLVELGIPYSSIVVVEKIESKETAIELLRKMLPTAYFDAEECEEGIKALDGYRYEWDDRLGDYKPTPFHNWASNPADALMGWAQGWKPGQQPRRKKRGRKRNWRTV